MTSVVTTGLSQGDFDTLRVLKDGLMQDILTIITAMVAGGGGISNIAAAGGGITVTGTGASRTLTVDLTALATTAATNTALGL